MVLIVPMLSFSVLHKYYLSLTQVEYIKEKESLQITMNVFVDDIERVLESRNDVVLNLNTEQQNEAADEYFRIYLEECLKVDVNGKPLSYQYLGHQFEGDVVYFYIEIGDVKSISTLSIQNKMLMDAIPEQQNLVKLKVNGTFKSLMLTKNNNKGLLKF